MKKYIFLISLCIVSLVHSIKVYADTPGTDSLNYFLDNINSFEARFEQIVLDESEFEIDRTEGKVWVKRPGKFRWDYLPPNEQQIIGNGDTIWIYDIELEQVTQRPQQAILGNTPAAILSGTADINENFKIEEIGNQGRYDWVNLLPNDVDSSFTEIRIGFEDNRLRLMELLDTLGQRTRILFVDLNENKVIEDALFDFTVPENVDLIDGSN